ncbi:hypothetical protein BMS3Abin04_00383 [bacterium BMS3Abin04]|nr:hypothetical protein BMS3Abin04_00383 [bacterium BMS3Abin04]
MKRFFVIILLILVVSACSKEEEQKLQLSAPEAFAYDVGGSWELHVTTIAKGFSQKKSFAKYAAKLSYTLDLITPSNDTLKALVSGVEERSEAEPLEDLELEAQADLDSTYTTGKYECIFKVNDKLSGQTATVKKVLKLGEN